MINIWDVLGIAPTKEKRAIRKAYAARAKECHPEENPEGFEELSDAYQKALAYAESDSASHFEQSFHSEKKSVHVKTSYKESETAPEETQQKEPEVVPEEPAQKSLMELLEEKEQERQKEQLTKGVLRDIVALYEDEKRSKKQAEWEKIFLSDSFLDEYMSEDWMNGLFHYLEEKTEGFQEPILQIFLIELMVAYGLMPEYSVVPEVGAFPGQKLVAKLWNVQPEWWRVERGERIMRKPDNVVRVRAVNCFQAITIETQKGEIRTDTFPKWREFLTRASNSYLFELKKNRELFKSSMSKNILILYAYWIKKYVSDKGVMKLVYKEMQLKELERSAYKQYYAPLKQAILDKYPDVETDVCNGEEKRTKARAILMKLQDISERYAKSVTNLLTYDATEVNRELQKVFEHPEWDVLAEQSNLKAWISEVYMRAKDPTEIPEYMSVWLDKFFAAERFSTDKLVQKIRTNITKHIIQVEKAKEYRGYTYWEYFFAYGFGIRSLPVVVPVGDAFTGINLESFVRDGAIQLPEYVNFVYSSKREEQRELLRVDEESGRMDKPVAYEFQYPGNHTLRMEFFYHFVAYYFDGALVASEKLSYAQFAEMVNADAGLSPEAFFALLAITRIREEDRSEARKCVREWLKKTTLKDVTHGVIAECIVLDNAPQMYGDNIFVAEQPDLCILVSMYPNGFALYRYTTTGLVGRYPRKGLDYSKMHPYEILQAHLRPIPKKIKSFDVTGLSNEQKAEKMLEGMYLNEKVRLGEAAGNDITHSYVVLKHKISEYLYKDRVFAVSKDGMGYDFNFLSEYGDDHRKYILDELNDGLRKDGIEGPFTYYMVTREFESAIYDFIAKSEDGRFFARKFLGGGHVFQADNLPGLLVQKYEFDDVVQVDVYEGRTSLSRFTRKPEYCFTEQDYRESLVQGPVETLAEYYTVF